MVSNSNAFGRQLKQYRQALDLTQQELGQRVGCSDVTIRKIELGERRPSRQLAELLAQHLQLPAEARAGFVSLARKQARDSDASSPSPLRSTLPPHLAPLIGREAEVTAALGLLRARSIRLLTFTGPGGVGKTSLARAVAHELAAEREVVWAELAALTRASQVMPTVGRALGMVLDANAPVLQRVADYLSDRTVLLALDNFEHVQAAAKDIAVLLGSCPNLVVLATSRTPLGLSGEQRLRVESLPMDVAQRLFVSRALESNPDLVVDDGAHIAIAKLCTHLDGLPLAIELVAARTALMTPQALLARFVIGGAIALPLVADGTSDLPERHRTLQAAIQWSLDLLTDEDRRAFGRLGIFAGDFSLDAATRVACATTPIEHDLDDVQRVAAWNTLTRLLNANLVVRVPPAVGAGSHDREPRFTLLDTVRVAARLAVQQQGDAVTATQRHAHYFAAQAELIARDHRAAQPPVVLQRLQAEMPNFMAAVSHAIAHDQAEHACWLCAACGEVWQNYAFVAEGMALIQRALALPRAETHGYASARASALISLAQMHAGMSEHARAVACCEEALTLYQTTGDERGIWLALHLLAWQCYPSGTDADDWAPHVELLEAVRSAGDKHWTAVKLTDLAVLCNHSRGDHHAAARYAAEAAEIFEESDDAWGLRYALNTLGTSLRLLGELDEAIDTLMRARAVGGVGLPAQRATVEDELGAVSLLRGDAQTAVLHHAAAVQLAIQNGSPLRRHMALTNQGLAEIAAGRFDDAKVHLQSALLYLDALPNFGFEQCFAAMCRIGLARIAAGDGRTPEAAELLRMAQAVMDAHPASFDTHVRRMMAEAQRLIDS
jgi:predicted ATPase/DNA-binding XRE family transcriptional regulator